MYVAVRVAIIVTDALELDAVSRVLQLVWLASCVYSWFAPALFRRMVARALRTVALDPEF
jgi:hypothetical protein